MINIFKKNYTKTKKEGFLMVEIIIAISIILVSVLASMSVAQRSISISRQSIHMAQANFLLEEGGEAMRILRDNAWTNVSDLTPGAIYYPNFSEGTWTLSLTSSQVGIFTRTVTVSDVQRDDGTGDISNNGTNDPGTKLITVDVSWIERGTTMSKSLSFYISNIFL